MSTISCCCCKQATIAMRMSQMIRVYSSCAMYECVCMVLCACVCTLSSLQRISCFSFSFHSSIRLLCIVYCHNTTDTIHAHICQLVAFAIYTCWTHRDSIKDVSVTLVPLAYEKTDNIIADTKKVSHAKSVTKKDENMSNEVKSVWLLLISIAILPLRFITAKMCWHRQFYIESSKQHNIKHCKAERWYGIQTN